MHLEHLHASLSSRSLEDPLEKGKNGGESFATHPVIVATYSSTRGRLPIT